jgi:filamentous hemagglutinin family protein
VIGLYCTVAALAGVLGAGPNAAARPPLPTPCLAGNCGTAATSFVQFGGAGAAVNGNTLNVTQSTNKAILNWADFNIANGFAVKFTQPNATSAVLNKIWSADPSVIAGKLSANGQVYLYNQNGIVFDKGAQVDVGGLVASTLPMKSDDLFERGILADNSSATQPPPVFTAPATGAAGAVSVNQGATLATADGGRIVLLGSAVSNRGTITTPDGQTILGAASNAVYLAASSNPQMRGLLIAVDGGGTTGVVTNQGQISAPRGNVTLAGLLVNQEGLVSATTSVSANGSIYLVAGGSGADKRYFIANPKDKNGQSAAFGGLLPNNGGTLLLAPGSVTEVLPDTADTGKLTVAQQAGFNPSEVDLAGAHIALEGNAAIHAPGGVVNAYAAANPQALVSNPTQPTADHGTVYLDQASVIDVSGLQNVAVPVTDNIIQVTLETNDLQNDPLLRTGFLHGAKVTVDLNKPPALFDVTPYAANIGANISEISTKAGSIQLNATGDVIARAGSTLNLSGGSIAYQSGYAASTTNLLGADGKVYNISTAPNNVQYVGYANNYSYIDPTWGTSTKGAAQSFYAGYLKGADAGVLDVRGRQVFLRGALLAQTIDGPYQRSVASLPAGGTFNLGCSGCTNVSHVANYGVDGGITLTDTLNDALSANIIFGGYPIASTDIPANTLISPTQLAQSGFSTLGLFSNGTVALPAASALTLAANGGLAMRSGTSIDIEGRIRAPGGSVSLLTSTTGDLLKHDINFGPGAVIDVSGNWTNDSPLVIAQPGTAPIAINGGKISASAAGDLSLGSGSILNVSGGGWINSGNALTEGSAGAISLAAGFSLTPGIDPFTGVLTLAPTADLLGASLKVGGGGTLALQSGSVTVGTIAAGTPGELLLAPSLFTQGGFSQYKITGQNDVLIGNLKDLHDATPVTVAPVQQTLEFIGAALQQPTGSNLAAFTQLETLPAALRAPTSVSFIANASTATQGIDTGDVTLAHDASIVTDPGAAVMLAANGYDGNVLVFGTILAPGGAITLQLTDPASTLYAGTDPGFIGNQRIELGADAVLAAPAYAKVDTLDQLGLREGSVLPGGSVSLLANKGFIQTDPGSLINVSGTAGILDLATPTGVHATTVAGNGGVITLDAREGLVLQGNLLGQAATLNGAAVAGAGGGTLNIGFGNGFNNAGSSGVSALNSTSSVSYPTANRILTLVGTNADGTPSVAPSNQLLSGTTYLNAGTIAAGGFDAVTIRSADTIAFDGAVGLKANASLVLDAPLFAADRAAKVRLSAPYVALGNLYNNVDYYDPGTASPNAAAVLHPITGSGTLDVSAQLIDLRGISGWTGFAAETLSSTGDIRAVAALNPSNAPPALNVSGNPIFEGAFNTSARLNLEAAQIYPTTATGFAINDLPSGSDPTSVLATQVNITRPASTPAPAVPLSAGGSLSITATTIDQAGVLRAPFGEIALNGADLTDSAGTVLTPGSVTLAAGSLTSVSGGGLLMPYGSTANGTQWTYTSAPGFTTVLSQPPGKQVSLTGSKVGVAAGAKVDLAGGGDLYAYEFIAGQGGSIDVLDPRNLTAANRPAGTTAYSYAIVPGLGSLFSALGPQYAQGSPAAANQTIYVSGVPGLAAGTYALLPARYALLPGAYAVQVVAANSGIVAGSSVRQPDGSYVVAGRFGVAGTTTLDSLTSSVLVASDATVRTHSQYTDSYANVFFNDAAAAAKTAAPRLPADAGQLLLSASSSLNLLGSIDFTSGQFVSGKDANGKPIVQQGEGGDVAITAQNLIVVDTLNGQAPTVPGTVELDVHQLDNLDAQTIILGASSANTAAGQQLSVGSQTVELQNTAALSAPQIVLAARDSVTVDAGAKLTTTASGPAATGTPQHFLLPGGGALLRVSNGAAVTLGVDPATVPQNATGTVTIAAGADVQAAGSLLLYGTRNTVLEPGAQVTAPAVSLYSSSVSLGDVTAGAGGLVLTSQLLGQLKGLTDLTIGSGSVINLYGAVQLGTAASGAAALNSINLDAPGIAGYGSGGKALQAGEITLTNSSNTAAVFTASPGGTGSLSLIASAGKTAPGQITLGAGDKVIDGFGALTLHADGDIVAQGTGALKVISAAPVPVTLSSAALVGVAGAKQSLTTAGIATIAASAAKAPTGLPAAGLGASFAIEGSAIAQNGTINMPAGSISLTATSGDVTLGRGSSTLAAGASKTFTVAAAAAGGGEIALSANAGNVSIGSGAVVDVSGAAGGDAGSLAVSAPRGVFSFGGSILKGGAAAGQRSGDFQLDVGAGLGGTGLTALDTVLTSAGFHGAIALRTRNDASVTLTGSLQASSFVLAADRGAIEVAPSAIIDTRPTNGRIDGGDIALWAGGNLSVDGGAQFLAGATAPGPTGASGESLAAHGGNITLGSAAGLLQVSGGTLQKPTTFAMRGSAGPESDGTLTLRAARTADESNVQITVQNPAGVAISSGKPVVVEGVQAYAATSLGGADAGCGSGGACDIADAGGVLVTDAANFMSHAPAIGAALGLGSVAVRPGIEIDSGGDLLVGDGSGTPWDLAAWNTAIGAPVNLTLRAAGNLVFNTSLTDGFQNNGNALGAWVFGEPGMTDSGSYRLTAGADLTAANPLATVVAPLPASSLGAPPNTGNVVLTPGNLIRTGTGGIDIAAGGDVLLGYAFNGYDANNNLLVTESDPLTSVIYTAGAPSLLTATQAALFTPPNPRRLGTDAAYPTGGGNLTIAAAGDIRSAPSAQLVTDWLWRRGAVDGTFGPTENASWWVMFNQFNQGVGVLGGGNLTLTAGRDVVNTSAVIPTTGRLLAAAGSTPSAANLVLTGGGQLAVKAGGDIVSGVFEDDWGNAVLRAGGALTSGPDSTWGQQFPNPQSPLLPSPSTEIFPIIVAGNGLFEVRGRSGVALAGIANSTTLPITQLNAAAARANNASFYTYAPTGNPGTLDVTSAGGNVTLNAQPLGTLPIAALSAAGLTYDIAGSPNDYLGVYSPTLNVAALSGDIDLGDAALAKLTPNSVDMTLFPSARGTLNLLAAGAINNDGQTATIVVSEADPGQVPNAIAPVSGPTFTGVNGVPLPQLPLHQNDRVPISLVAGRGDIAPLNLAFPKAADIIAGGNIADLNFNGKNLRPSDVTLIAAGGDITYSTPTQPITNALINNDNGIALAGPGHLEVLAGGSINLGDANGILTTGSLTDPRLAATGASLVAGAGWGTDGGTLRQPAAQSFIGKYLAPDAVSGNPSAYAATLIGFMQQIDPTANAGLSYAAALTAFKALTPAQQLPLLAQVLSDELSATGLAHSLQGAPYDRGYAAIDTLFPAKDAAGHSLVYSGDLNMFFSQLKTEQGGDIDLLVPGGSVVVGVPNPPASLGQAKAFTTATGLTVPAEVNLGVLVLGEGAVRGFADQNFEVNQSRILTLEGGNIILWASNGNIDAGKGAKSASGAPPPVIATDANGNLFVNPSNAVSGSGIGQLLTTPGLTAGLVNLIAPKGAVDAGDAGIRVAGNLNIAAVQVIGAGNITVVGTSSGVPVSSAGALAGALNGANSLGDTAKNTADQLSQNLGNSSNYQALTDSLTPTFIVVKMFCLGVQCETN